MTDSDDADDDVGTTPSLGSSDDDSSTGAKLLLPPPCSTFISTVVSIGTASKELSVAATAVAVVVVG